MYVYLGPDTYAGQPWPADEVAKGLVSELSLKKGDTVSKNKIVEYMSKHGLGPLWATDVAMVLRDMFGVTPVFFEHIEGGSSSLLEELQSIVLEKEVSSTDAYDFTENDLKIAESYAVAEAFADAVDERDEAIIASLSMESIDTVAEIMAASESVSDQALDEAIAVYTHGGEALFEDWYNTITRPHLFRFLNDDRKAEIAEAIGLSVNELVERVEGDCSYLLSEDAADDVIKAHWAKVKANNPYSSQNIDASIAKGQKAIHKKNMMKRQREIIPDKRKQLKRMAMDRIQGDDLLAKKAQAAASDPMGKGAAFTDAGKSSMAAAARSRADRLASKPGMLKRGLAAAGRVIGRAGKWAGSMADKAGYHAASMANKLGDKLAGANPSSWNAYAHHGDGAASAGATPPSAAGAEPGATAPAASPGPAKPADVDPAKPSWGQRAKKFAGGMVRSVGSKLADFGSRTSGVLKSKMRMKHPGLSHVLFGDPGDAEKKAATQMGMSPRYAELGQNLPGYDAALKNADIRNRDPRTRPLYRGGSRKSAPNNPRF